MRCDCAFPFSSSSFFFFFNALKWVTVDCEPHGIGGADEQVRRETGYWRIEGTRHANPSSRCQQPILYTHTRPGLGRSCARYTTESMHRERERKRETAKEGGELRGGIDRHLIILYPVFARLHELHVINTRSNSLRRPH